ncbi:MAG TPA: ABC transporter permease [Candidatus Sulfotelmatobacter sp.]|nr:ABC transporter permease [Candidatus Sulfotelmatobacter sp.]
METLLQNVRYAFRQLRKYPGFTAVAVLTLALGIGANTAIFTLLDQVLLRSLPVKDADRLVILQFSGEDSGHLSSRTDEHFYFSYPMYRDLRDRNSAFDGLIATDSTQVGVQWHNQPELVTAELVSGNYFDVLGVRPATGRLFATADESAPHANPVAVLSFNYWQRRFGADPAIVNQSILINGSPFTVVGIARQGFKSAVLGDTPGVFVPMTMKAEVMPGWNDLLERRSRWLNIIGRLRPGINRVQAEASLGPLWYSVRADELKLMGHKSDHFQDAFLTHSHLSVLDGARGFSPLRADSQTPLTILMAMVGVVILMACANVSSLLLVRAAGRMREMSVRYALGAKRRQVLSQLLVEGVVLGLSGGALGIAVAPSVSSVLIRMVWSSSGPELPFSSRLDWRVLLFNFGLAIAVSLLFSMAPAIQFWRPDLMPALKPQVTATGGTLRFRRFAVGVQLGLSLLLLIGAGLFVRTLQRLKTVDVGFATDHLLTFQVNPSLAGYAPTENKAVYERMLQNLDSLPGVRAVAATNDPELANDDIGQNITIAGYNTKENEEMEVERPSVSPRYFSAMGMPLLSGREFDEQDRAGAQKTAVINETMARHFFGTPERAIGRYFGIGGGQVKTDIAIVGVVKDAKHGSVRQEISRTAFTPYLQDPNLRGMAFYVRTWQSPEAAEATVRRAMQALDSKLVLDNFRTMPEQIDDNLAAERTIALLASGFGVLAVFMAAVGLYGVLAYSTAQRTREIGLRIALGAARASVMRMVLLEVLWLAGISIALALPASILLARAIRSQLFGITATDPLTLCVGTGLIAAVALASAYLPARRATQVDPVVALRYE